MIYRIESRESWEAALPTGKFVPDDYGGEGFIHCSALEQVEDVANQLYHGGHGLVLLCISQKLLHSEVCWERADNGLYYPHVYGPIDASAVAAVIPFPCSPDGTFVLPPGMPDDSRDLPGENDP